MLNAPMSESRRIMSLINIKETLDRLILDWLKTGVEVEELSQASELIIHWYNKTDQIRRELRG